MIGVIGIVFALLPETPWWLVSQNKMDKARKSLEICNGDIKDYDCSEQLVRYFSLHYHRSPVPFCFAMCLFQLAPSLIQCLPIGGHACHYSC